MLTISNAPSCGVTYDRHSDNSRGAVYDCNIFIVKATGKAEKAYQGEGQENLTKGEGSVQLTSLY